MPACGRTDQQSRLSCLAVFVNLFPSDRRKDVLKGNVPQGGCGIEPQLIIDVGQSAL